MEIQEYVDPEILIRKLTEEYGIKLKAVEGKLGVPRTQMMSWRRSTTPHTKAELSRKLIEAYPQYLEESYNAMPKRSIEIKYIEMLEKRVKELEEERNYWKNLTLSEKA